MVTFELLVEFREIMVGKRVNECYSVLPALANQIIDMKTTIGVVLTLPLERLILHLRQLVKFNQLVWRNHQRIFWFQIFNLPHTITPVSTPNYHYVNEYLQSMLQSPPTGFSTLASTLANPPSSAPCGQVNTPPTSLRT